MLEIGAGTGLVSICAAQVGRKVYATDIDCVDPGASPSTENESDRGNGNDSLGILELLACNCRDNLDNESRVSVRVLDLTDESFPLFHVGFALSHAALTYEELPAQKSSFSFRKEDLQLFASECTILLGADIIYLDHVTFHLVRRLPILLLKKRAPNPELKDQSPARKKHKTSPIPLWESRTLYLAFERRIHFVKDDYRITAPAWDFFLRTVEAINLDLSGRIGDDGTDLADAFPAVQIALQQIELGEMPHCFEYERVKELELWKVFLMFEESKKS
ncbi:hypothetical protein BC830DRAFT_609214 [Chytriomyces sp. MP71]|nr:hypothetical protein BC830DRAFT_609214 [Chytriomyces sp. MP71]